LDEAHILGGGKSKADTFSLWGRRENKIYGSRGLKSINSYNTWEGKMIRVWFFCSCIPKPSLVLSVLLSLGHHNNVARRVN